MKTDGVRLKRAEKQVLDGFDRMILSELVENARQTYAEIGRKVNLSAPAVHDRVKRLRHPAR